MDLFDLMTQGADPKEKALDRLDGIITLYRSPDEAVRDEALARAITLCSKEWGGYAAGLEALACRYEQQERDELEILQLREEATDPGYLGRLTHAEQSLQGNHNRERLSIIAHYGSEQAALALNGIESLFVQATLSFCEPGMDDATPDPWGPVCGWSLPWHPIPPELQSVISQACPWPHSLSDARDEVIAWEQRLKERACLADDQRAALPTVCMARLKMVTDLWRRDLPVATFQDLQDRLDYWQNRGGDDGSGYRYLARDMALLLASNPHADLPKCTKDRVKELKSTHPAWSLARIGLELGISRQAVHKHLKS